MNFPSSASLGGSGGGYPPPSSGITGYPSSAYPGGPPSSSYPTQHQQQQYDQYGQPIHFYPPQQQQQYQQQQQGGQPQFNHPSFYQQQQGQVPPPTYFRQFEGAGGGNNTSNEGAPERILRNPHPSIPLSRVGGPSETEAYDPSLPTYNATPMMFPGGSGPSSYSATTSLNNAIPVTAPTLSSIFQAAEEKVSQMARAGGGTQSQRMNLAPPAPIPQPTPVPPVQPNPSASQMEIITGIVTQMQEMFGMVSGEIFFQISTVVGSVPKVGDKVVVEAERVSGMPFKFNGKRVQVVSKDLLADQPNEDKAQDKKLEKRRKESKENFGDFGPLPSMPFSLNLPKPVGPAPASSSGPLKSILKRNPPPPPMISKPKKSTGHEIYRPESPVGFKNGSFSLDLRGDFPIIKQPSSLEQLYPELMFVSESVDQRRDTNRRKESPPPIYTISRRGPGRSPSPSTSRRDRKSRSPEKFKRRSRSLSPRGRKVPSSPKRRSRSPKRRSRSPRKRSLSPLKRRSRSPKPKRRTPSPKRRSRSPVRRNRSPARQRSRSPKQPSSHSTSSASRRPTKKELDSSTQRSGNRDKSSTCTGKDTSSRGRGTSSSPVRLYNNVPSTSASDGLKKNPLGDKSGIKSSVGSSTLLIRPQDAFAKTGDDDSSRSRKAPLPSIQPQRPVVPIKFSIAGSAQTGSSKPGGLVPNPAYTSLRPVKGPPTFIQNPNFGGYPQAIINQSPSAIVASTEQALKKINRKKKVDSQEPAYKVVVPIQKRDDVQVVGQRTAADPNKKEMWEEERQLLKQKKTLEEQISLKNSSQLQTLKMNVELKLKGLREKFETAERTTGGGNRGRNSSGGEQYSQDPHVRLSSGNGGGVEEIQQRNRLAPPDRPPPSQEEIEKLREEIQRQKFLEEERRLKSVMDSRGLERLWLEEDRRRRGVEEDRLERTRLEEIKLKKDKNWTALKKLREEMGGTAERDVELARLRELRAKEEMAEEADRDRFQPQDEHTKWLQEEEEVYRRADERAQRGCEGPVLRLIMDTEIRQLTAANLLPEGPTDGMYSSHHGSPMSQSAGRRGDPEGRRRRGDERSRSRERSRRRSPQQHHHHRDRHPSPHRSEGRSGRSRRSMEDERTYRREDDEREDHDLRGDLERRRRAAVDQEEEERRIMEQMEEMQRQEEELQRRELEIYNRIQMMERNRPVAYASPPDHHQQQQQQQESRSSSSSGRRSRY